MISGIYKIQSKKKPERIYIGSSKHIHRRWNEHKSRLLAGEHWNAKLQRHFNKYGWSDLEFSVIVGCDRDNLMALEQFYIDALDPWFNLCKVAVCIERAVSGNKGRRLTEEHKRKISASMSGERNSMYGKPSPRKGGKGYPSPFKGKKGRYSEETLQKMRKSNQRAWDRRKQKKMEDSLCQE
jgi:group I intron endonuclease